MIPLAAPAKEIFRLDDPRGDDFGAGGLKYPTRDDMRQGALDLEWFRADTDADGTWFRVRLAQRIVSPRGRVTALGQEPLEKIVRSGFYTFNIDVYIDTDRITSSGRTDTLPGRGVDIAPQGAWEKAVILTPRPQVARAYYLMQLEKTAEDQLREERGRVTGEEIDAMRVRVEKDLDAQVFFPDRVRVRGREVHFFVPSAFTSGQARPEWGYSVMVTGCDVEQIARVVDITKGTPFSLMVIPVGPGLHRDRFGLVDEANLDQPPIVDVLASSVAEQQRILSDYDPRVPRLAAVPPVSPSGLPPAPAPAGQVASRPAPAVGAAAPAPAPAGSAAPPPVSGGSGAPAAAASIPQSGGRRTVPARLKTLNTLRDDGLISDDEYQQLRRKILSEI
jgi:hypothetical protein